MTLLTPHYTSGQPAFPMEPRTRLFILAGLAVVAVLTYLPALKQPFIADDYGNILLARTYGPAHAWKSLAAEPVQKYRPIFMVLTYWVYRFFGPWPPGYILVSIALHMVNTWLVFALGVWPAIGWRVSALSAMFFAVYEGHQEAVMWYSAAYELLLLFFGLVCFVLWVRWLQGPRRPVWLYAGAMAAFVLALLSKESAVALVPLLLLPVATLQAGRRRGFLALIPFFVLGLLCFLWVFAGARHSPRLEDGSFSFRAPVFLTWLNSYVRLFWIWGLAGLAALAAWGGRRWRSPVALGAAWAGISLIPYSFLTYMTRVPSRHTYLASVGLSWIVAAALWALWERFSASRRWLVYGVVLLLFAHNIGYLWTRKRAQYLERAAATEALVQLARRVDGPVFIHRFPYPLIVAQGAVMLRAGKKSDFVIWAPWGPKSQGLEDYLFSLDGSTPLQRGAGKG